MRRLFFALWPDPVTRDALRRICDQIEMHGIRKLKPDNLHATLVFLGNVDDEVAAAVQHRASEIRAEPFTLVFDELSFWRRPQVLCLTCSKQPKPVYELVNALTRMILDYPVRLEARPYSAHVTLARKVKKPCEVEFEPLAWQVSSFALVESLSTDDGVRYQVIGSWALNQAG